MKELSYNLLTITWNGDMRTNAPNYRQYTRSHIVSVNGKPDIPASSDPAFRGDATMYNPEELLMASLSSCHMLWFLSYCVASEVVVVSYQDKPVGKMVIEDNGSGQFTQITLQPTVTVAEESMLEKLEGLHHKAHEVCFIANSLNFEVKIEGRGKAG